MHTSHTVPHKSWIRALPRSRVPFPSRLSHRAKYFVWRVYTPLHPRVRDVSVALGVVSASSKIKKWGARQRYLLGTIAPNETIESVIQHLVARGYANHFVAWKDAGEVVSLRYVENFVYQYHIRIFEDGEVRGHYEFTPECYPLKHYHAVGSEDRRDYFLKLFGERIVPAY